MITLHSPEEPPSNVEIGVATSCPINTFCPTYPSPPILLFPILMSLSPKFIFEVEDVAPNRLRVLVDGLYEKLSVTPKPVVVP
jgi:hypothetical protein